MTRRGHVYRRKTKAGGWSRWYAVIDAEKEPDGRRRQVTRSFDTRTQAYAWLAEQQNALEVGGPTVAAWLRDWLASRADLRASTVATYVGHIENYLVPLLGGQLLRTLSTEDLVALHEQLAAAGVSTVTARRIHATLSSALSAAVEQGIITNNPTARIRLPKPGRYQAVVWSAEQASRFLAATSRDEHACLWRLALVLGMRRGELAGLRWDDLDLNAGTVTITTTRVAVGATVVEGPPKSARSRRMLPLDPHTVGMLGRHQARQTHHARQDNLGPVSHVFTGEHGQPVTPAWISRRFTEIVQQTSLPRVRFHDLRHASATLGLAAGESLKEVSARLGHSSIMVTADTYLAPPDSLARASTQRLAGVLDSAWQPPTGRAKKRAA
jgi:integrase